MTWSLFLPTSGDGKDSENKLFSCEHLLLLEDLPVGPREEASARMSTNIHECNNIHFITLLLDKLPSPRLMFITCPWFATCPCSVTCRWLSQAAVFLNFVVHRQ